MLQLGAAALSGFTAPLAPAHAPAAALSMVERSAALPFLKKPPALDGSMVGDEGFDPLGFSTTITELGGDLCYVREAELMHGRQAMLACVGFVWPAAVGKLPVDWAAGVSTDPLIAQHQLPSEVTTQLFLAIAIAEGLRARKVYGNEDPGNHGFDPIGFLPKFCGTPEKLAEMKLKEIRNGRLAMIGITGMAFQDYMFGHIWPLT